MKFSHKRVISVLLLIVMVLSFVPSLLTAEAATNGTGYTKSSDVQYYTSGKYTANWGYRGETCVFLSPNAISFYSDSTSFDALSKLEGGSTANNAYESDLYAALKNLMYSSITHKTGYDETKNLYKYTDCQMNDTSKISCFYSGTIIDSTWNAKVWNREHTWPQSKCIGGKSGSSKERDDIMMLRPASISENSSRGNKSYGESSGYYDPDEQTAPASVRGDVARIALYIYTCWGNTNIWGHYKQGDQWYGNFESLDILLKWMEEDPVDTWEMGRNDAVQSITGTRNVFVDYPEYAWLLFGRDVPENITTPSDNDGVTANPGGNNGSSTGGNTDSTGPNYTQISSLSDGDKVLIVNPASNMALSAKKTGYYNEGVSVSAGYSSIADTEIYTATKNSDGTWSFTSATGKKLALADEYNSLNETGANNRWELTEAGTNQFYLKNVGRNVYLNWYSDKDNWSTYSPTDGLNSNYVLAFYKEASASTGNSTGDSAGSSTGGSTGGNSSTATTNPPASSPATDPADSQPGTSEPVRNDNPSTTAPSQIAPMGTNPVNPDDFIINNDNNSSFVWVIVAIIVVVLAGGGVAVWFFVIKPKMDAKTD